jgi:hypothetical protein
MNKTPKRVRVVDGDTGEIYSYEGNDHELVTADEDDKVHYGEAFIVAAQRGWKVLGLNGDDIMLRTWDKYKGKPHNYTPCEPPSWFNAKYV